MCGPAACQAADGGTSAARALQDAFVAVADRVEPAVVTVIASRPLAPVRTLADPAAGQSGSAAPDLAPHSLLSENTGSGVIVSPDGWIVTNDHVVSRATRATVRLHDGREFQGTVLRDYATDIALVKVEATGLPYASFAGSDAVKVGQWAVTIGSPYKYEGTFAVGVVSALHRHQLIPDRTGEGAGRLYADLIQTDAAINPGNSGGPLVNLDGEVIGINSAVETADGKSVGIGFAISADLAHYVADELRAHGRVRYGQLGVTPGSVTERLAQCYGVQGGALVTEEPGQDSPAGRAGIHVDDVITSIDARPVKDETDLRLMLLRMPPGTEVTLTIVRSGHPVQVKATLAEAPSPLSAGHGSLQSPRGLGLEVAALTREAAEHAGLDGHAAGVVVRSWDRAGPASQTELAPGDVVIRVNGQPVGGVEDYHRVERELQPGAPVRLVWQGRRGLETKRRLTILTVQ